MRNQSFNKPHRNAVWLLSSLMLAGCAQSPEYLKPELVLATSFKEGSATEPVEAGQWKTAQPSDAVERGRWWEVFDDPLLNQLEEEAQRQNQNLQAAVARLKQARALARVADAGRFPDLNAGFGPTRQRLSAQSQADGGNGLQQTLWRAQVGASYEVDMFGRVAASVSAANADTQRSIALLRSVMLSVQADVAQNYFALRQLDAELAVFSETVKLREQGLELIEHRFALGDIGELDVARARAELATTRSDAMSAQRLRAVAEHRLALLLGKTPAQFSLAAHPLEQIRVDIPPGLPSALLERRPDIAAAERAMAAANARIGIAKAAFFPSLTLTAATGFESGSMSDLFKWSSRTFLLGPLVGTALNTPLFDGGLRKGNLAYANAVFEEDVARYREQVFLAFQEVEDNLSELRILREQSMEQARAVEASARASTIARTQYDEGNVIYLSVLDAQRTALQSRRGAVQLQGGQAIATVNLIKALGGGWEMPVQPLAQLQTAP
ncbi:efflux transporter outer membrane subunit [Pseudomonas sp. NPDC090201]|uniref:efflux transporter outer membrane subunit n=1 Tax=Pseudomonas sp. NPDC090201 TaxID=3364475 RepID=UPI003815FD73